MSFIYTRALGLLNPTVLTGDLRALLVMTNTTADTEEDVEFISGITTLDEYGGANYARVALTSNSFAVNTTDDRFVLDCDSITFSSLGAGARDAQAMVIYLHVTDDTDSKPLFYIDEGGFPFTGDGNDVTRNIHSDGLMYIRNPVEAS